MFYLALGLTISISNLTAPLTCFMTLFHKRQIVPHEETETENKAPLPKSSNEMRLLIKGLEEVE